MFLIADKYSERLWGLVKGRWRKVNTKRTVEEVPDRDIVEELGGVLYTVYVYPFEIAAVILLVAIIAAIALTMRRRPDSKSQRPSAQVAVRREDRVRIVKMPAEKKR